MAPYTIIASRWNPAAKKRCRCFPNRCIDQWDKVLRSLKDTFFARKGLFKVDNDTTRDLFFLLDLVFLTCVEEEGLDEHLRPDLGIVPDMQISLCNT